MPPDSARTRLHEVLDCVPLAALSKPLWHVALCIFVPQFPVRDQKPWRTVYRVQNLTLSDRPSFLAYYVLIFVFLFCFSFFCFLFVLFCSLFSSVLFCCVGKRWARGGKLQTTEKTEPRFLFSKDLWGQKSLSYSPSIFSSFRLLRGW